MGGERDDGDVLHLRVGLEPPRRLPAVHHRKPEIQEHEIRQQLLALDKQMLGECRHVFTNARNTAARLERFNGVQATPLYHPPPLAARLPRVQCQERHVGGF